ncbi:hypothetical protein EGM51_01385 [Verrucomicrobia bacterium S94]|nr:hypothetical protein EGM51_01385 [Verrucomicrobia bacterium S94]
MRRKAAAGVVVLAMTSFIFIQSSDAGYKWEGFDGGNAPGFIKLGNYTWNEHNFPADYKQWRASGFSWGAIKMSSKITVQGQRCEAGGWWQQWGWKNATFEARCLISGATESSRKYSWAAWWVTNLKQTWNNYYEVDLMECCDTGNYFNYYYHYGDNGVVGKQRIMPNSFDWRNSWNNYKCWPGQPGNMHYYLNGSWKQMHAGVDRRGEEGQPKFQNRVWPTRVVADNAAVQNVPDLVVDWYQVWY